VECREARRNLSAYLDGELSAEKSAAVRSHLPRCPSCRAELHFLERLWAITTKALSQAPFDNTLVEKTFVKIKERRAAVRRSFASSRLAYAAAMVIAAAAIVLLASYYLGDTGRKPAALAVDTAESAFVRRAGSSAWQKLGLSDRLYGGDVVKNASTGLVTLKTPRESKLVLNHNTSVQMGADPSTASFDLIRGELFAHVNKEPFLVRCDGATVTVSGTSFSVRKNAGRAVLTVHEGLVSYASGRKEVKVRAGQQSVVITGRAPSEPVVVDSGRELEWLLGAAAASVSRPAVPAPAFVQPGIKIPPGPDPGLPFDRPLTKPEKEKK
jgi:ferric-dicitrate binding protein FerR (iron transport regulator)